MLTEAMTTLAADGAEALVSAMATDRWPAAGAFAAELFAPDDLTQRAAMEGRLERSSVAVKESSFAEVSRTRSALRVAWRTRFEELLEARPEAAAQLQELVARLR